jgi:hypothetical protein
LSGFDLGRLQRLGGQAFDRIAVQIFHSHAAYPLEAQTSPNQIEIKAGTSSPV